MIYITYNEEKITGVFGYIPDDVYITITEEEWIEFHNYKKEDLTIYDGRISIPDEISTKFFLEKKINDFKNYLSETDWVEPFLIKHYMGIDKLSPNSSKFEIETKRNECREFIKNNPT